MQDKQREKGALPVEQSGENIQNQNMNPIYTKSQSGCLCQRTGPFLQTVCVCFKAGAEKYEQTGRKEIVVQHIPAVHRQRDSFRRGLGQISQQAGCITCYAAQINQDADFFLKFLSPKNVTQQKVAHQPLHHGSEQINVDRQSLIKDGTKGGGKQNDAQKDRKLPGSTVVRDPFQKGTEKIDPP